MGRERSDYDISRPGNQERHVREIQKSNISRPSTSPGFPAQPTGDPMAFTVYVLPITALKMPWERHAATRTALATPDSRQCRAKS